MFQMKKVHRKYFWLNPIIHIQPLVSEWRLDPVTFEEDAVSNKTEYNKGNEDLGQVLLILVPTVASVFTIAVHCSIMLQ